MDTRNKIFVVVGTVAILGTAGVVGALLFTQQDTASTGGTATVAASQNGSSSSSSSGSSSSSSSGSSSTSTTSSYKDGTYTASQSYRVPHGESNSIQVTVTISSGKISAVTANDSYTDGESGMYIQSFESSVSSVMVGQSMGSTSFSRIGGASLTSMAFYDALDVIATQAQS